MKPIIGDETLRKIVKVNLPLKTLEEHDILRMLTVSGALNEGHFQLLSGKHSDVFLKFRSIAEQSNNGFVKQIGHELASRFQDIKIDVVLAPVKAGSLLVDKITEKIQNSRPALVEVESDGRSGLSLRKGSYIDSGERVLIVNDMTTSGEGLRRLIQVVGKHGGVLTGIGLFATRSRTVLQQELIREAPRIEVVIDLNVTDVRPVDCDLCAKNIPLEYSVDHC